MKWPWMIGGWAIVANWDSRISRKFAKPSSVLLYLVGPVFSLRFVEIRVVMRGSSDGGTGTRVLFVLRIERKWIPQNWQSQIVKKYRQIPPWLFVCRKKSVYDWLDKACNYGKLTIPDSVGHAGGEPRDTDSAGMSCGRDN